MKFQIPQMSGDSVPPFTYRIGKSHPATISADRFCSQTIYIYRKELQFFFVSHGLFFWQFFLCLFQKINSQKIIPVHIYRFNKKALPIQDRAFAIPVTSKLEFACPHIVGKSF